MKPVFPMRLRALACVLAALSLAACSAGEAPRTAQFVPPVETQQDFGDLRVHFNALPTLSLSEAVAREYGVERTAGTALVVIAVRRIKGAEEVAMEGDVSAVARDLSGKQQTLHFRPVRTGDYIDHIGTVDVGAHDTYRFEVTVRADGRTGTLQFARNF